jgi:hypothetical protein
MKKKILLISPFKNDIFLYPHLQDFIELLEEHYQIEYFHFRERGYWIKTVYKNFLNKPFKKVTYQPLLFLLKDILRLVNRISRKYDSVIAIDIFSYTIAGLILKKHDIILWSHDFISLDNPDIDFFINKFILKKCKLVVTKNKKIIIQDKDRLQHMLDTIKVEKNKVETSFLPVSLKKTHKTEPVFSSNIPVLMQMGGINDVRSNSHLLLEHFEKNRDKYLLFFHGFIEKVIENQINKSSVRPIVSSLIARSKSTSQIVELCAIGFISYNTSDINFHYIAYASGQLAEFLRMGKPIIFFGNQTISNVLKEKNVGVSINNIDELNSAIQKITNNYHYYSDNCHRLYNETYCIENYFSELISFIK